MIIYGHWKGSGNLRFMCNEKKSKSLFSFTCCEQLHMGFIDWVMAKDKKDKASFTFLNKAFTTKVRTLRVDLRKFYTPSSSSSDSSMLWKKVEQKWLHSRTFWKNGTKWSHFFLLSMFEKTKTVLHTQIRFTKCPIPLYCDIKMAPLWSHFGSTFFFQCEKRSS